MYGSRSLGSGGDLVEASDGRRWGDGVVGVVVLGWGDRVLGGLRRVYGGFLAGCGCVMRWGYVC